MRDRRVRIFKEISLNPHHRVRPRVIAHARASPAVIHRIASGFPLAVDAPSSSIIIIIVIIASLRRRRRRL